MSPDELDYLRRSHEADFRFQSGKLNGIWEPNNQLVLFF